jgi:DNA-binding NtrC family response regulator
MSKFEGATVLVVEDEIFVRMIAADMLEESGFRVLEAPNAADALEILDQQEVAVVFTDINMPGTIDGFQMAEIIAVRYPRMKVIITSGKQWLDPEALPDASVFLPKPYRPAQLIALVELQVQRSG